MTKSDTPGNTVKFAVFADLHIDIMHDSLQRLKTFLDDAATHQVDFLVNLGDLTYPDTEFMLKETGDIPANHITKAFKCSRDAEKQDALRMLRNCGRPVYHVLGNHEMDSCTKEQALKYLQCDRPYYSFDVGQYHFIVLDCNYIHKEEQYISFQHCNYHEYPADAVTHLPPEQLAWLEADIMASPHPSIVFSHQSLSDTHAGLRNREQLWELFRKVNRDKKRVILCMNGHSHIDGMTVRDEVYYVDINSMSNIWIGGQYSCIRYSEEIDRAYPYIKKTAPYREPLYAIVTLTEDGIVIKGAKSEFVGPSPYEVGFLETGSEFRSTAVITDHILPLETVIGEG